MSAPGPAAQRLLECMKSRADPQGVVSLAPRLSAQLTGIAEGTVRVMAQYLIRCQAIERLQRGIYRITGTAYVHVARPRDGKGSPGGGHPPPSVVPCSYATARECGIEPMTVLRPWVTPDGISFRAITLARVPCLERELP